MKISVFGLGYVGSVSAAWFADRGHLVLGVDPDSRKTEAILAGRPPQAEPGLEELIRKGVGGNLRIADGSRQAIEQSDLALVCVGTPSDPSGGQDLTALRRVCEEIGAALDGRKRRFGIVIRSTCMPGTLAKVSEWVAGAAGDAEFAVAGNPEFLREGSALADFSAPPFTIIGTTSDWLADEIRRLYDGIPGPVRVVKPEVAEALKLACNAFHATKVTFANEIGRICRSLGVDGREVMEVFCEDRQLNVSHRYLRPGFSFGGSCLPKDVRALVNAARRGDISVPMLASLGASNEIPISVATDLVLARGRPKAAMIGLSFKPDTDDMRESPLVEVVERLLGKGVALEIYDPDVRWDDVFGTNRRYVEAEVPHIANHLVATLGDLGTPEVVIVGKEVPGLLDWLAALPPDALVVDLVGRTIDPRALACEYRGIAW